MARAVNILQMTMMTTQGQHLILREATDLRRIATAVALAQAAIAIRVITTQTPEANHMIEGAIKDSMDERRNQTIIGAMIRKAKGIIESRPRSTIVVMRRKQRL